MSNLCSNCGRLWTSCDCTTGKPGPSLKADMAAWIEQHSHGDLFARLEQAEQDLAGLRLYTHAALEGLPCGQCDEGERLEQQGELIAFVHSKVIALEQQCKQCYLESKGEGP